jgi:hypothetical protein
LWLCRSCQIDLRLIGIVAFDNLVFDVIWFVVVNRGDLIAHLFQLAPVKIFLLSSFQRLLEFLFFILIAFSLVTITVAISIGIALLARPIRRYSGAGASRAAVKIR